MLPTLPVDDEHDIAGLLIDIGDDLRDQSPHQSLARSHRRSWRLPCRREIIGQSREVGTSVADVGSSHSIEPLPTRFDTLQRGLPRPLQLRSDQAIVGVTSGIATFGKRCIVLSLLQLQLCDTLSVMVLFFQHTLGLYRCFDRHWRYGA